MLEKGIEKYFTISFFFLLVCWNFVMSSTTVYIYHSHCNFAAIYFWNTKTFIHLLVVLFQECLRALITLLSLCGLGLFWGTYLYKWPLYFIWRLKVSFAVMKLRNKIQCLKTRVTFCFCLCLWHACWILKVFDLIWFIHYVTAFSS